MKGWVTGQLTIQVIYAEGPFLGGPGIEGPEFLPPPRTQSVMLIMLRAVHAGNS